MSGAAAEIGAYFARIAYRGPPSPTLATLQAIVARHSAAIPFENLDVLLQRPVSLEQVKGHAKLKEMALLRYGRLSVQPVTAAEFAEIVRLGG